jgi:hypothetical protein
MIPIAGRSKSGLSIMASHRPGDTEPPTLALLALG